MYILFPFISLPTVDPVPSENGSLALCDSHDVSSYSIVEVVVAATFDVYFIRNGSPPPFTDCL